MLKCETWKYIILVYKLITNFATSVPGNVILTFEH